MRDIFVSHFVTHFHYARNARSLCCI